MTWLNWLEHRVGFLAIPRLIPTIALLNAFSARVRLLSYARAVPHSAWRNLADLFLHFYSAGFSEPWCGGNATPFLPPVYLDDDLDR